MTTLKKIMLRIFNTKIKTEILIDDTLSWIIVTPKMYLEPPHIQIEISDFFMLSHANECDDCKSFINAFGKESTDWFLEYNSKKYQINTSNLGSKDYGSNKIQQTRFSEFNTGTLLVISLLVLDVEKLNLLLVEAENNEEYEACCRYRDLISEANK